MQFFYCLLLFSQWNSKSFSIFCSLQDDTTEGEYDVDEDYEDEEDEQDDTGSSVVDEKENNRPASFGSLHFSVKYNFEKNALTVTVQRCESLISRTVGGGTARKSIDPYVKLQLLPEKVHRAKTRVLRNTDSPIYNEEFTFFGLNYNQLQGMVIHFAIISFDRYSRDEVLGELLCPLSMIDLATSDQETALVKEICTRQKVRAKFTKKTWNWKRKSEEKQKMKNERRAVIKTEKT